MTADAETEQAVTEATIREWASRYDGKGAPRLAVLCAFINATFPQYEARMESWGYTPDKTPRERTRWPGVRREGKRIAVYERPYRGFRPIFDHFPGEPYRHNSRVCRWIVERLEESRHAVR